MSSFSDVDNAFLRGPNIPTSRGCNKCEECAGIRRSNISHLMQWRRNSPETWLSWPSQIKTRFFLFALSRVEGSNTLRSHCNPSSLLVHSFELDAKYHCWISGGGIHPSSTSFAGIHIFNKCSPVNMINGGIELPSAQIHSIAVVHSWRPGSP